jgi:hypothetical protein
MSSQFPDLKNEFDQIPVPMEKLDAIIANTVNETKVKKPKKRNALYSVSAAFVGFGLFIGSAMVSPAMAKVASNIPVVGAFFNDVGDEGLKIAGQKGLTQVVDQTAKDNGITLTINEIFYDGTRLTLGYTQESLLPIGEHERPTILVDGKEINFSSGYSGDYVTPQKYKGVIDVTPTEELPEEFEMKIRFDAVGLIPGKWKFTFPVRQSSEVTVIKSSEVKMLDGAEVTVDYLKLGPAGTDLRVKVIADEDESEFDPLSLKFYLIDDQGNVLTWLNASGQSDKMEGKMHADLQYLYEPVAEGVKKVKVIPYDETFLLGNFEKVTVMLDEIDLPYNISQGEFGEVMITDIKYTDNRTVIYFDIKSDAIIDDRASESPIWLVDANGKNLILDDQPFAQRIKGNSFKQEFPTGKKKGLMLKTTKRPLPVIYESFEIEIP